MIKILVYLLVMILVIISMDSLNINNIFKKNKILQARLFYFLIAIIMIYIVTNFIFDIATISKIF